MSRVSLKENFLAWCQRMAIPLFDWQREAFGEALRRENGKFVYRIAGISVPRGNGKSDGAAKAGKWLLTRKRRSHVLSTALGRESAKVVLRYGQRLFRDQEGVEILADAIRIPSREARWDVTSREHTSSRGEHPDASLYDECGWAQDDELFSSLLASQAGVADPVMLVVSTVGRTKSGPLWRIKQLAEAGEPGVFFYYRQDNPSPLITPAFLARQKKLLLPGQYAREHENSWEDSIDAFVLAEHIDRAMGRGWVEQVAGGAKGARVMAVDLGAVHDPTVIGVGHEESGCVYLDRLITIQGTRQEPVQLSAVEQTIRHLAEQFRPVSKIRIESWQGLASAQRLTQLGLPVELFTPTAKAHAEEWPVLAQRFTTGTLTLPQHPQLREELLNLGYEITKQGVRVFDRGTIHQDHAVVLRMICAAFSQNNAWDAPCPRCGSTACFGHFLDASDLNDAQLDQRDQQGTAQIMETVARQGYWWPN